MFLLTVFLCCTGAWLCVHFLIHFQGWYGPAGIKSLSAIFQNNPYWDEYTTLIYTIHTWLHIEPVTASYALSYVGYIMTCMGLSMLAGHWFSLRYSIIPSLILYAPLTMIAQLIGADIICIGLVFLGLGFSIRLLPLSVAFWLYSAQLKSIALPALALIPCILPWTLVAIPFLLPFAPSMIEHIPHHAYLLSHKATPLMLFLGGSSLLLSFLHKYKRIRNITIVLIVVSAAAYVSLKLSTKLRPRYLVAPTLPLLIVMTGLLNKTKIGTIGIWFFWGYLLCDSWSFLYHWDQKFVRYEGKTPSSIPIPPTWISSLSSTMTDLVHSDHSAQGAESLQKIGHTLPKGGIIELRDTRHHHLIAPLTQRNREYRIVSPQTCCTNKESIHHCAIRILQEFNQSGGTLVLPTTRGSRIKTQRETWIHTLIEQAQAFPSFQQYDAWWYIMPAQHNLRNMPCIQN